MRIGIVGCGVSGLTALKCCREEGLEAICFEMTDQIGGLWSPREPIYGLSHCYESLITNTSKELSAFSDHPFPAEYPTFLPRNQVYQYLQSYCERFDLAVDVRLEHKVHCVEKCEDHDTTGCWQMTVEDLRSNDGKISFRVDAVMICTGMHSHPFIPDIPNMQQFQGVVSHSHGYTNHEDYDINERVMVVGNRSSGLDIATDLVKRKSKLSNLTDSAAERISSKLHQTLEGASAMHDALKTQSNPLVSSDSHPVYLSARSPVFAMERDYGHPWDARLTLFVASIARWCPWLYNKLLYFAITSASKKFSNVKSWLKATNSSQGAVSDEILRCLKERTVKPVAAISAFTEKGVKLSDGEEVQVDRVVMATGYSLHLLFLHKDTLSPNHWHLYKRVWPVDLHKNSLALIGFVRAAGSIFPLSELQARWAVQVFKGKSELPSVQQMKLFSPVIEPNGQPIIPKLRVESLSYAVELAGHIGCYPSIKLLLTHPVRWLSVYFGSLYPYIFRLSGPGQKSNAWDLISTAKSRIHPSQQQALEDRKRCQKRSDDLQMLGWTLIGGIAYLCFWVGILACACKVGSVATACLFKLW